MVLYEVSWRFVYWDEYENQYGKPKNFKCLVYAESPEHAEKLAEKEFNTLHRELPDDSFDFKVFSVLKPLVFVLEQF